MNRNREIKLESDWSAKCGCGAEYSYNEWLELELFAKKKGRRRGYIEEIRVCDYCGKTIRRVFRTALKKEEEVCPCFICQRVNCSSYCETFRVYLREGKWRHKCVEINELDFRKNVLL